jgi:hypothetical protein
MLIAQEKSSRKVGAGAICPHGVERRHRIKMNKAEIRELIAPIPVYPGVGRLCSHSVERI